MTLAALGHRDDRHEAGGLVAGVTTGIVTQNQDPEGLGRVKLKFPWRGEGLETDWVRVAAPMASSGYGAFFLPEVEDEVLVGFDRDDIRYPYVLGRLWNKKDKPPEDNADGKNDRRVIRSRKGHKLVFDDGDDGCLVLELDDGKIVVIDDHGITIDDKKGNQIKLDSDGGAMTLQASRTLTLKAPQIIIEAQASMDLKGGTSLSAQATMVRIN